MGVLGAQRAGGWTEGWSEGSRIASGVGQTWEMWVKRRQGDWGKRIILVADSQERRQDSGGALTGIRKSKESTAGWLQSWSPDQVGQDQQPAEGALTGKSGVASIRKGPASHLVPPRKGQPRWHLASSGVPNPQPDRGSGKKNDSRPWRMGR